MASRSQPAAATPHDLKYPDRQSLPGSAQRNVPVLVEALLPLLLSLLKEPQCEGEGLGEGGAVSQPQPDRVRQGHPSPVRVLEIAAGHGDLTLALRRAMLSQQQQRGATGRQGQDISRLRDGQVQWTCTEADDALVQSIRSNILRQEAEGETEGKVDEIAVARLEINDEADWSALTAAKQKSPAAPASASPPTSSTFDLVLIANLLHIMPFETVRRLFSHLSRVLSAHSEARVCIYGAFNEEGNFTSEGNKKVSSMSRPFSVP